MAWRKVLLVTRARYAETVAEIQPLIDEGYVRLNPRHSSLGPGFRVTDEGLEWASANPGAGDLIIPENDRERP